MPKDRVFEFTRERIKESIEHRFVAWQNLNCINRTYIKMGFAVPAINLFYPETSYKSASIDPFFMSRFLSACSDIILPGYHQGDPGNCLPNTMIASPGKRISLLANVRIILKRVFV